jgi:hypothetical protein
MTVGYSGTPLAKKLGYKPGMCAYVSDAPADYRTQLKLEPGSVTWLDRPKANADLIHVFVKEAAVLGKLLARHLKQMARDGTIWVSWPKKASKVPTDITEDRIRAIALPLGLVDVKVCAVDEIWSGLKLVIRRELR